MSPDRVRAIADAVLYEGYVLWPYRRSSLKNAQRWTFGGVHPRAHAQGRSAGDDPWTMQTQCLVEGEAPRVSVGVRFLHVVWRQAVGSDGAAVDELVTTDGERHLSWEEAVEREVSVECPGTVPISIPAGRETEVLPGGSLVRSWDPIAGTLGVTAEPVGPGLHRITVLIANETPWAGGPREAVMRQTLCSTHTVLRVRDGAFVSLTDPPPEYADAAEACENRGTWPVLAGEEGDRGTLLSSPIILADHPEIAPESPGDFFDGGEIDQMLVLNILALTDAEKAEARATDPRTRELLDRSESLAPEDMLRLSGRLTSSGGQSSR